ncbi:MAG: hypothetical protein OXK76_07755 [Gammaproteobacteria bacterium]|nr:hypothetical protein [Gammaproteobacteria bacterium]
MYSFELVKALDAVPVTVQVVFAGHGDGDERLASTGLGELVEGYNRRVPPSRLLFVCPFGVEGALAKAYGDRREDLEGRLASASHVVIAPYDNVGKLVAESVTHLKCAGSPWAICDGLVESLAQEAVSAIFDDAKTILHAPHGYAFRKLSNREEDIFVRAGNMLRDPKCLAVFGYLLLRRMPPKCSLVYIDSFTILSFALGIQSLVDYFRRLDSDLPALAIENFHSYEITPEFRIPNEADYFVLISASTSGGLARKLVEEKQADAGRIVHLLGVGSGDSPFRDSCVYFRERGAQARMGGSSGQRNALIEIGTEEFLVAQGPPTAVALTREHVNRKGSNELHKSFYRDALKFHAPGVGGAYSTFSMAADATDATCPPIRRWVGQRLVHELPASVRMVVHVEDPMSACLAGWLVDALPTEVPTKSASDLAEMDRSSIAGGAVVVVAYGDPGLERVREVNIALRSVDPVHRHYVVGYAFPPSRGEHRRLKLDLRMGPSGPQYGWSEYLILPVGAAPIHESLIPEYAGLSDEGIATLREQLGEDLAEELSARNARSSIPDNGLFLPRTDGEPLRLRHGSVFFAEEPDGQVSQVAVYAMVSAAVQAAREPHDLGGRDSGSSRPRFDDNPFVRTVLDPSMFARFNDGILQACLLRATQRSELDYTGSDDLSRQFASVCQPVLGSHGSDVGDAALEFVFAIMKGKVSLRAPDAERLRQEIDSSPALKAFGQLVKHEQDAFPRASGGH